MGGLANFSPLPLLLSLLAFSAVAAAGVPRKVVEVQQQPLVLKYHNGRVLRGSYTLNVLWYGHFSPAQRAVVADFIRSISPAASLPAPSVASWWRTTAGYKGGPVTLSLGRQLLDEGCSLGKSLKSSDITALARKSTAGASSITVVLTAADVVVEGFCSSRCGTHASLPNANSVSETYVWVWVGNSMDQCPGQCAWPFHQPIYGPQAPPLVAPNGDVGIDGVIINLATVLAGTVTNPYGNGYFQGPATAPLEAVTACTGAFGKGAYPGFPGELLVDPSSGASYNAHGLDGRKYLLPAMWDPNTSQCSTLV